MFGDFKCHYCGKLLPRYYVNKGDSYYGDRGRYNFRGAKANALKHVDACRRRAVVAAKDGKAQAA